MSHVEEISKRDEIRALFIFGLLAVLASIRVQYSQLMVELGYGSFNLVPIIDYIIAFWSLYAFFMVIGLSEDIIGRKTASIFRGASKVFLQYSYFILGFFLIPIGFIAYGARFILVSFIIILVAAIGLIIYLSQKRSALKKQSKSLKNHRKPFNIKKHLPFIVGLIFVSSSYVLLHYPQTWLAPIHVTIIAYIVSAITAAIYILLQQRKTDDTYTSDDDYYC